MSLNVLIVDDHQNMLSSLVLYLTKMGFKTQGVSSVQQALEIILKEKFDAVVADISLKEFSGIVLLKSIKSRGLTIPVIIMSGYARPQLVRECLNLGAYDFLFKPFRLEVLAEILQNIESRNQRFLKMGVVP